MKKLLILLFISLFAYLNAVPVNTTIAQTQRELVSVQGRVISSLSPYIGLPNAQVTLSGIEEYQTLTNELGEFFFSEVESENWYNLQVIAEDYDDYNGEAYVGGEDTDLGDIYMIWHVFPPYDAHVQKIDWHTHLTWRPPFEQMSCYIISFGLAGDEEYYEYWDIIAESLTDTFYTDYQWENHEYDEVYMYCIRACDTFNNLSEPAFTNEISKFWYYPVTVSVSTFNGASAEGATVTLQNTAYNYTDIVTNGEVQFPEIWRGYYTINVNLIGYQEYIQSDIQIMDSINLNIQLLEPALPPANLAINDLNGLMSWDEPVYELEHYNIYLNSEQVAETTETSFDLTTLDICQNGTTYTAGVSALYTLNNESEIITTNFTCHWNTDIQNPELQQSNTLTNIYPNPFNPETIISFELVKDSSVIMEVYNLKGQKVNTLINADFQAGTHNITWKAANLSSGTYLLRSQIGSILQTRKLILLK